MRNRLILAFVLVTVCATSFLVGFSFGIPEGRSEARREFIQDEFGFTYNMMLEKNIAPQLREYLKVRFYYYSLFVPEPSLQRLPLADQGPISAEILGEVRPVPP